MQILITHASLVRTRVLHFNRWQLALRRWWCSSVVLMLLSGAIYHFIFLKAAREGWPVVSQWSSWSCATRSRSANASCARTSTRWRCASARCRPSWSSSRR